MLKFLMQGKKCDVRNGDDVKKLVAFAQEKLKYIDIWVLNTQILIFGIPSLYSLSLSFTHTYMYIVSHRDNDVHFSL